MFVFTLSLAMSAGSIDSSPAMQSSGSATPLTPPEPSMQPPKHPAKSAESGIVFEVVARPRPPKR